MNSKKTNNLINEKSPYLLHHAYNPVNWYPWSKEAFDQARKEDKPIFLSIGYSTCHWCHVMERESFEDNEVADVLNQHFISIKVDREERPDVDHIYMTVCQTLTGSGGWPLSIFMTPDMKPFFAGTYFPRENKMGMAGFINILKQINLAWKEKKEKLIDSSEKILNAIKSDDDKSKDNINEGIIYKAFSQLKSNFDSEYGGFGNAPKFPIPHNLLFLLRYWYKTRDENALQMVEKTLDSMYKGGIYDHIGFGFSRYSTDRKWLVPHFEKMLYDNALLSIAYLETYQATDNSKYAQIAEQIFSYVEREMTSEDGGFYSAQDADSEGEEGKFYIWSIEEIQSVLGGADSDRFCKLYDITKQGNFEEKNILNLIKSETEEKDKEFIDKCKTKLLEKRKMRIPPFKDDKILTSWNGLMIAALSIGSRVLNAKKYTVMAEEAVKFIYNKLIREDGRLFAGYRDGKTSNIGFVDDYAFLIWGLIELYQTTFKTQYLQKAINLNDDLLKHFWDDKNGGLFVYGNDSEQLIIRPKEIYDGAIPSGNSVAALNFIKLSRLTGEPKLEEKAEQLIKTFWSNIEKYPIGYTYSLISILNLIIPSSEVIISFNSKEDSKEMIDIINSQYRPFTLAIAKSNKDKELALLMPFLKDYKAEENKATAYVCTNFSCKKPVTKIDDFIDLLD